MPRGSFLRVCRATEHVPELPPATTTAAASKRRPKKTAKVSCEDCFFHKNMLCALDQNEPCPTFRHHEQGLKPPQQLAFVFRQERPRSAWVFEQPR